MKCPRCGADSSVSETRTHEDVFLRRARVCFNEHKFTTLEVHPGNVAGLTLTKKGVIERAASWLRKQRILRSTAPAAEVAKQYGLTATYVRYLRRTK